VENTETMDQDGALEEATVASYSVADAIGRENITDLLSEDNLKNIAADCFADFDIDDQNFKSRREKIEELYKLALQVKEEKNYPFTGASNVKYPLLTKAALSFAALAYPAIVKDNTVVKGTAVGSDEGGEVVNDAQGQPIIDQATNKPMRKNAGLKGKRAARVGEFMSWQVLDDMDGWEDDMDKLLHIIPVVGCAFKKTFYDPIDKKNVSRLVLPQYLIVNLHAKTMQSAMRVSEIFDLYPNEIEENIRLGLFREFDYSQTATESKAETYKPSEAATSADSEKPHQFIEQHRWLDLDGDDYKEPYIVWLHKDTREVVRIMARFDQKDIIGNVTTDAAGNPSVSDIKRITAQCYYEIFNFIPDPEGSIYGIGFGHLLQHLNEAANTSINQLIDAGHRNIMGGGFIAAGLRIKSGDMRFRPGEYKRADSQGGVLKDSIVPLPMPEPSQVMMALMQFLIEAAEAIAIMTKALNGDTPANMPATTALATIEQGLQPFKAVFKRVHRALKSEFQRLYYLDQKYITPEQYRAVLGDEAADVKADFQSGDVCVYPVSDPEMVNNIEQIMRASILAEYKDDPLVDAVEVRKRIFRAVNIKDVDDLVKIPPKVPDELVEAQKAALNAQTQQAQAEVEKLNRDNERADIKMALEIEETMAGIQVDISTSVLNLAKAQATEHGVNTDVFMANVKALESRVNNYAAISGITKLGQNGAGGGEPVEAAPGQPAGSQVPAGPPAANG
jgi:chaperonin GroES